MDYVSVPPPEWDTAVPDEWSGKAISARAMARYASAMEPALEPMFSAWAKAWEWRSSNYEACRRLRKHHALAAVEASASGEADVAKSHYAKAVEASRALDDVRASFYRSYLETIPNR